MGSAASSTSDPSLRQHQRGCFWQAWGLAQPRGQKSPTALGSDAAVWEVTSGVLLRTKSRPWQVCKAEISEPLGQPIYVAAVYSKEQPPKQGLELFVLIFKSLSLNSCDVCERIS